MKKLLLAVVALLAVASAYGQGRVAFANTSTTLVTTASWFGDGGPMAGLGNYYIALYVGNAGANSNQLILAGLTTNSAAAGRFTGGNPFTIPVMNGVNYGDGRALSFQIRGWTRAGNSFTDYESARAAANSGDPNIGIGESDLGVVTPTFSPTGAAPLFGTGAGQLSNGFIVFTPTPEPSSVILGLLGLAAIALFRRRK